MDRARKHYFLSLSAECLPDCRFCARAGCKNSISRDLNNIKDKILRAKLSGYTHMEFAANLLLHPDRSEILQSALTEGLPSVLQIDLRSWLLLQQNKKIDLAFDEINFCVEANDALLLERQISSGYFTFFPSSLSSAIRFFLESKAWWNRIHLQLTPFSESWPSISAREAHILIEKVKKSHSNFSPQPPKGREVWDPRIDPDLKLEALLKPSFQSSLNTLASGEKPNKRGGSDNCGEGSELDFSIVIPTFNSKHLVKSVVRHLLKQDYDRRRFEIILVDDGSTDETLEHIRNYLSPEFGAFNFTYFYFPRNKGRKRGDGNFRAGIARNQGAKFSKGKYLCFLDSDIIVPSNFLSNLKQKHESFEVIQNIRLHLKSRRGNEHLDYEQIDSKKDTYILESNYWGKLFQTKDWQKLPFFWKYTCTYSLSLPRNLFEAVGAFKKTFVYYGFEDTDLGYRLWKKGARFHLNPLITYHLETSEDRTEYRKSSLERHMVLSKTAKVFYINNPSSEIFMHLYSMMGGEKGLKYHFAKTKRSLMNRVLPSRRNGVNTQESLRQN